MPLTSESAPSPPRDITTHHNGGGAGVGTRPWCWSVCLWRHLLASRHCTFRPSLGPKVLWLCQWRMEPLDDLFCLTTPGSAVPETGCCPCRCPGASRCTLRVHVGFAACVRAGVCICRTIFLTGTWGLGWAGRPGRRALLKGVLYPSLPRGRLFIPPQPAPHPECPPTVLQPPAWFVTPLSARQ